MNDDCIDSNSCSQCVNNPTRVSRPPCDCQPGYYEVGEASCKSKQTKNNLLLIILILLNILYYIEMSHTCSKYTDSFPV